MDIRALRYFFEICRLGSFTKASEKLYVAQPALSVSVKKLENERGVPLLVRQARNVAPTAEGRILLEHAQRVLLEIDSARQAIDDAVALKTGEVRVGLPPMFGLAYFPSLIAQFHDLHPGIVITAIEGSADEIAALLDDGEIEIAMLATKRVHSDWCKVAVGEEEIVLCVPDNSPLAGRKSVSGHDLNELPMVLFSADFIQRDIVERICKSAGAKPRIVMQSNYVSLVSKAVTDGLGATTLLRALAESIEGLVAISFDPPERISFALCWRNERYLSKANRAFVELAKMKGQEIVTNKPPRA